MDEIPEIVARAQQGDRAAQEQLCALYRSQVRATAQSALDRRTRARVDASDVTQEALTAAMRGLPSYQRRGGASFLAWLRQIVRREVIHVGRVHVASARRTVLREATVPDEGGFAALGVSTNDSTPSGHFARDEQASVVRRALAALDSLDRHLLVERFVQGGDIATLAAARGVSPGALRQRLTRALHRLGDTLKQFDAASDSAATSQRSGEA